MVRAGLVAGGGVLQLVITSVGLRLMPELRRNLLAIPTSLYSTALEQHRELLGRLRQLPQTLPALSYGETMDYSLRLVLTMAVATEVYHRIGIQSGYWIPMTALLVQKPAFFETLTRATLRIVGTLIGAWLCSLLIAHLAPAPVILAVFTTLFALLAFATSSVNYGLFAVCLTAYIVFLLSLNQIPGTEIAQRRAWCTLLGGLIALAIHVDALLRHRSAKVEA
jgi:uncharacterized membrane protein YccC